MKKLFFLFILFISSYAGFTQATQWRLGIDSASGNPKLYRDTLINLENYAWSLTGNAIADSNKFLGTTTNWPLILKNNSIRSGQISDSIVGNTGFGYGALRNSVLRRATAVGNGSDNTGFGARALSNLVASGYNNTAIGSNSMPSTTTGFENTAVGYKSLFTATSGNSNVVVGSSGMSLSNSSGNIAIGNLTLQSAAANNNVAVGQGIMKNITGGYNTGVGDAALNALTSGQYNTAVGQNAMGGAAVTGFNNAAVGVQALTSITGGGQNVAMGYQAAFANTSGSENTALGREALWGNGTGSGNVAIGYWAGKHILGWSSGLNNYLTTANNSIFIGDSTRANANSQNNQIVIGNNVSGLGSNTTVLGDSLTTHTLIYGSLLSGTPTNLASSQLTVNSTTKGALLPRMNTTQMNAISSPATGLLIFNTDSASYVQYTGSIWQKMVGSGGGGGGGGDVTMTGTQTLTNKRITKRIGTTASSATPTPDGDANDQYNVTALAAGATFGAPTGTPTDGQELLIRVKDNGTARTLAWNAIYRAGTDFALPATTVISKTIYVHFTYNAADTKWDATGLSQGY